MTTRLHTIAVFCPHIGSGEYASCNQRIEIQVTEYSADFFNPWQLGYALPSQCPAGHPWSYTENKHLQGQIEDEFDWPVRKNPPSKTIDVGPGKYLSAEWPPKILSWELADDLLGRDSR